MTAPEAESTKAGSTETGSAKAERWPAPPLPAFDADALTWLLPEPHLPPLVLRPAPEAFYVEEVPAYLPTGEGEHLYLRIRKRQLSTPAAVKHICRTFGCTERDVGFAGRKDANGVTVQWLSLPARKVHAVEALNTDQFEVLEAKRHNNKLRLGHLTGNLFRIEMLGAVSSPQISLLEARLATLSARGFPNYFGAQRFGAQSVSVRQAERFLAAGRKPRGRKDRFLVSVFQSVLFNHWLNSRMQAANFERALDGDILLKEPRGAPFCCTDPRLDTERVQRQEVTPGGPLVGVKMRSAERVAMTAESRSRSELGVAEAIEGHPAFDAGARRPARVVPRHTSLSATPTGLQLAFELPPGCYATVFIRELCGASVKDQAFDDAIAHMNPHGES